VILVGRPANGRSRWDLSLRSPALATRFRPWPWVRCRSQRVSPP